MPGPVERWLETFMCKQYADTFEAYGFKTLQSVCQLQGLQLQAMGVAEEDCEKILENVHVLRQTLGGNMNHYQSEMYNTNLPPHMNYPNHCAPNQNMMGMHGGGIGYGQGFPNPQQMTVSSQEQFGAPERFYPSPASGQSIGMEYGADRSGQYYGTNFRREHMASMGRLPYEHMSSNSGGHSGFVGQLPHLSQQQQQSNHVYGRHGSLSQNPQEVANNILQMAAVNYQPSQTVHVPLSKSNRPAPYHVPPKSPHGYAMSAPSKQYMMPSQQFVYPNSAPHIPQMNRTSPVSPMYSMHSPASHHSAQSLPNSSPRSIHSPSHSTGSSGGCKKSPAALASPIGDNNMGMQMHSPPYNYSSLTNLSAPLNQQLHVNVPNSHHSSPVYTGEIASPHHQKLQNRYSPKTNPVSPPNHRNRSRSSSVHSSHSSEHFISPPETKYINEQPGDGNSEPAGRSAKNPLSSLEQLCMLPERQVIDPKSVVNEACLESATSNQNQKNSDSDVGSSNHIPEEEQDIEPTSRKVENSPGYEKTTKSVKSPVDCENAVGETVSQQKPEEDFERKRDHNENVSKRTDQDLGSLQPVEKYTDVNEKDGARNEEDVSEGAHANSIKDNETKEIVNDLASDGKMDCDRTTLNEESCRNSQEISTANVVPDQNCNLQQCRSGVVKINGIMPSCDQRVQESVELPLKKEECRIFDDMVSFEKIARENNNEFLPGSNGDENSCIQYYKPKSLTKRSKRALPIIRKPKYTYDKSIRSKILSSVNDFSLSSDEAISRDDALSEKLRLQHSHVRRSRSLHSVSAALTVNGEMDRIAYSDSDSDDDGVLLVRKDNQRTYDRSSRVLTELKTPVADGLTSQEGDVSSDNESVGNVTNFSEKEKENMKEILGNESGLESVVKVASDVFAQQGSERTKSEKRGDVVNKGVSCISKNKGEKVKVKSDSVSCTKNMKNSGGDREKSGSGKKNSHVKHQPMKTSNEIMDQDEIDGVNFQKASAKGEASSSRNKSNNAKAAHFSSDASNKRTSKRRRRASPMKYGDLYYGADYVIDSDDELEIEKKSKRLKKGKHVETEELAEPEAILIDDSDEDDDDYVPNKAEIEEFNSVHDSVIDERSGKNNEKDEEPRPSSSKSEHISKAEKGTRSVEKQVDIPRGKQKKKQKDVNSKKVRGGKSSKGKLRKFEHSVEKFKYDHDSIENIRLKKTLDLLKQKDKKPSKDTSSEAKSIGPVIRMRKSKENPTSCHVVNVIDGDQPTDSKKVTKKTTSVSVSTVHMSKVPSEKSVQVPHSTVLDESNWVCSLCRKHSSYKFLGDLFGPYYIEGNLPKPKDNDSACSNLSDKTRRRKSSDEGPSCSGHANGQKARGRRKSSTSVQTPVEVWVHEDCAAWADGVLLIGPKIYGLEEAASIASSTVCSVCNETGATVGCLHKGCSQKFHVTCAVEADCFMDEENFSLLCPKHKSRILKKSENIAMKA